MFGALIFDVVLLIIGALLLFRVTGYNFMYAVNVPNHAYAIPSGAVLPVPGGAVGQHSGDHRHHPRLLPLLGAAVDDRQHLHADPVVLRLVL